MSKSTFFLTQFDVNATGGLVVYIVIVIAIHLHWHMMATMIEDVTDFSEHNGRVLSTTCLSSEDSRCYG